MKRWNDFQSPLAEGIKAYLTSKRALGKRFKTEEEMLRLLDRYLIGLSLTNVAEITPAILEAFLASRPRTCPRSYNHLLGVVRRLFDWLVIQCILPRSPLRIQARPATANRQPFIFNRSQARQLLSAAVQLPDTLHSTQRGETYELALLLMYGLGLRVGEVARLWCDDVDLNRRLLVIRQTKFAKSRLVPFGPRVEERIRTYLSHRERYTTDLQHEDPLLSFSKDKKKPLYPKSISHAFHQLVGSLELTVPPGVAAPRAHHLRHYPEFRTIPSNRLPSFVSKGIWLEILGIVRGTRSSGMLRLMQTSLYHFFDDRTDAAALGALIRGRLARWSTRKTRLVIDPTTSC